MTAGRRLKMFGTGTALAFAGANLIHAADSSTNLVTASSSDQSTNAATQNWNFHVQNTDIIQYHPAFNAPYSGPNSLPHNSEVKSTESLDFMAGVRLWQGAEAHVDALVWQGFGLGETLGIENFPNNEAFRAGNYVPNINLSRVFIRQTFGFGGDQEDVEDDELHLAGKVDVDRLTLTVGRMSAKDIFDNNAYANDARTQFMSWGLTANEAWDYPADSLGYMTGLTAELNQSQWTERYGFFQVPKYSNHDATDQNFLKAWGMVWELEHRYTLNGHPGSARLLGYLNQAHMGNYEAALSVPGTDITQTREYRHKYGFGLNIDQEIVTNIGVFARIGWSDGRNEAWVFSDVDSSASLGLSIVNAAWGRPNDTYGLAEAIGGISREHQLFLEAGGTGILAGDGKLNYGWEESTETYYDFQIYKSLHAALDFQFVNNPAFNKDRGPVYVLGGRIHWEF